MVPRSLKSTTTQPAVGGPKTFWEDQRAWRPKNLTAQRAEGTKVLRRQKTGGTINIYQTDRGQKITHLCRWLNLSKFTRFLGGPNGPKICGGRTKTDFKDRGSESNASHRDRELCLRPGCIREIYDSKFRKRCVINLCSQIFRPPSESACY